MSERVGSTVDLVCHAECRVCGVITICVWFVSHSDHADSLLICAECARRAVRVHEAYQPAVSGGENGGDDPDDESRRFESMVEAEAEAMLFQDMRWRELADAQLTARLRKK